MAPELTAYDSILANSSALTVFIVFGFLIFSLVLISFNLLKTQFNWLLNKLANRFKGNNRKLEITLTVNDIYLIQRSLNFRAKVMDDYTSFKSYELIDKLTEDLINNRVPFDISKIGSSDFDDL